MIWSEAAPLKFDAGLNDKPLRAVLTLANMPVKTITGSSVPSPVVNTSPAVVLSVTVPFVAVSVILIGFALRSTSATEIWLALPLEKTFAVSSFVLCGPGTVFTGGSLTAVMVIPRVADPMVKPSVALNWIVRDAVGLSLLF